MAILKASFFWIYTSKNLDEDTIWDVQYGLLPWWLSDKEYACNGEDTEKWIWSLDQDDPL